MEILEINEANWADVLDEYDPTETLTVSVRTVVDDDTFAALSAMRERLPVRREVSRG